ncbi:MAG: hypothetical protein GX575_31100, partial [Candidatus Anammoximicrobium sp.]|nr:hypothetical protein [Candidatus Anammoximicrobium sp.]
MSTRRIRSRLGASAESRSQIRSKARRAQQGIAGTHRRLVLETLEDRRLLTSATAVVSAAELTGMQLLYAVNNGQFDFNDVYTVDNSAHIPTGSFSRVGYFVELGSNWVYTEMDTFDDNPLMLGVPKAGTNIVENGTLVNNLHVETNHPNVTAGVHDQGILEFWASNYGPNGTGLYGSSDGKYDWKDSGGSTSSGHGSFQVSYLNPTLTSGGTLFNITAGGGSGIGVQNPEGSSGSQDWTFGPSSSSYSVRNLEIWVGKENAPATISDLQGDSLSYAPGVDGVQVVDQGTAASVDDPAPIGVNGWNGGNLTVSIAAGGASADDVLGILNEGSGAGQIGVTGANISYEGTLIGTATGGASGADLLVTFNATATTAAVSALLDNITYQNTNAATTPSTRWARFTLTDGDAATSAASDVTIAMDVGGAVTAFVWDGSGDGSSFSSGANWEGDPASGPDANDLAIFRTADPGVIDLGGGTVYVGEVRFDGTGSYTLQNGTLATSVIDQQAAASGDNVIAAQLNSVALDGRVSGGSLAVTNTSNRMSLLGGSWTVNAGGRLRAAADTGSGLGAAAVAINLNGGTLEIDSAAAPITDALGHVGYHINSDAAALDLNNNAGVIAGGDPTSYPSFEGLGTLTNGPGGRGLDFNADSDFTAVPASLNDDASGDGFVITNTDNYSNLWIGTFTPNATGSWGFRNNDNDDIGAMWIDLDQDGVFESSVPGLGDNRGEQLIWESTGNHTRTLTAGQQYLVAFLHNEDGGNSLIDMRFTPPSSTERVVKPADAAQAGLWSFTDQTTVALGNNVTVTADSAINVDGGVSLGTLTLAAGASQVDVQSGHAAGTLAGKLTFAGAVTLDGAKTFLHSGGATLNLQGAVQDGAATGAITKTGDGTLILAGTNTYGGDTTIASGLVALGNNSGLGNVTGKTVIQSGGTLDIRGFRAGLDGNEPVAAAGTGVNGVGAIVNTGSTQLYAFRNLTLTGAATFRSDNRWDIRDDGGDPVLFGMNGFGLTKVGGSDLVLYNTIVADPGSVSVNQATFRLEGSTAFGGAGPISVASSATLDFYSNAQTYAVNLTLAGGANVTTNDGAGAGPTLTGAVTLNGTATFNLEKDLTINGQVTGAGHLNKTNYGMLVLTNAGNSYGSAALNGGELRITHPGALGGTSSLHVDTGESLEFDGTMTVGPAGLTSLTVAGGTLRSISGTTTLETPISLGIWDDITFDGAGNLIVTQPFGYGGMPLAYPGLQAGRYATGSNQLNFAAMGAPGGAYSMESDGTVSQSSGLLSTTPAFRGWQDFGPVNYLRDGSSSQAGPPPYRWTALFPSLASGDQSTFQMVWMGDFTPDANGDFTFRSHDVNGVGTNIDDDASIFIDANLNGAFESSEGFSSGSSAAVTATGLTAGTRYPILLGFWEGWGDERISFTVQGTAGDFTSETVIDPSTQNGLFSVTVTPDNSVFKTGAGAVTFLDANTYNGLTTVSGGTLVAAHDNALGTTDGGTVVYGGTLALQGDVAVSAGETLTLGRFGGAAAEPGSVLNLSGANRYDGDVILGGNSDTIESQDGVLTVGGSVTIGEAKLTVTGAGDAVIEGGIGGTNPATVHYLPGLLSGYLTGSGISYAANPGNDGIRMSPHAGLANGSPTWADYRTWVYTGQFYDADGRFSFGENIDDVAWMKVDGVVRLNNGGWNTPTGTGVLELGMGPGDDGWHDVEIRFYNGAGGAGAVSGNGWTTTKGFGLNASGTTSTNGADYPDSVTDPGDGSLWRSPIALSPYDLIKSGAGTLTLTGNNTYVGLTDVQEGTLVAAHNAALGWPAAGTTVRQGATLGLDNTRVDTADDSLLNNSANLTIAEALTIYGAGDGGGGALRNMHGDNAVTSDLAAYALLPMSVTAGLELWLDAARTATVIAADGTLDSGDVISGWNDVLYGDNTVANDGTQAIVAKRPIWNANAVNGQPAIQFDGLATADGDRLDLAGTLNLTTNATIFFVALEGPQSSSTASCCRPILSDRTDYGNTGYTIAFKRPGDGEPAIRVDKASGVDTDNVTILNTISLGTAPDNAFHYYALSSSAASTQFYEDGVLLRSANLTSTPSATTYDVGGNRYNHARHYGGSIAEIIAFNGTLSAADRGAVEDYLRTKYLVAGLSDDPVITTAADTLTIAGDVAFPNLTINGAGNTVVNGLMQDAAPDIGVLTKDGTGTLTLTADNTYSGGTTVAAGTLLVNNASGSGTDSGAVTVANSGVLGGTGTVGGTVMVAGGASLSPGSPAGTAGRLSTGTVTLNAGSAFAVQLNGAAAAGSDYDQLSVSGTTGANGAGLAATLNYAPGTSDVLTLLHSSGTLTPAFQVNGVTVKEGDDVFLGYDGKTYPFQASYAGNDFTLSFDPAPVVNADAYGSGIDNAISVTMAEGNLLVSVDGNTVLNVPASSLTSLTINGQTGNDTLTVDQTGTGGPVTVPVIYDGGTNGTAPGDDLVVTGGTAVTRIRYDLTGAGAGQLFFNGNYNGTIPDVTFSNVEPALVTGSSVVDVTVNVDPSNNVAGLNAVTVTDAAGTSMTVDVSNPNAAFERLTFPTPASSLTILGDDADDDVITITSVDGDGPFQAALTIDGQAGTDAINLNVALNLSAGGGALAATAESIAVGAVTIQTSGNQTYNGPLTLSGSTLNPGAASVVLGGDVTAGGTAASAIRGQLDLGGAAPRTFTVADATASTATDLNVSAVVSNGGVTKAGPGTMTLSGSAANTYSGLTTVAAGELKLSKTPGDAVAGDLSITTGGKVTFGASHQISDTAAVSMSGAGSLFNGTSVNGGSFDVTEKIGSLTVTGGCFNTASGGTWTITGAGSFTGGAGNTIVVGNSGTQLSFGSLSLTDMTGTAGLSNNTFTLFGNSTARQSAITVGAGGLTLNGSKLNLRRGDQAGAKGSKLVLNGNVTTVGTSASAIREDPSSGIGALEVQLSGTAGAVTRTFTVAGGGANLTVTVPVTDGEATPGGLAKAGDGTLTLSGGLANTYSGMTTVNAGGLTLNKTAGVNAIAGDVTVAAGTLTWAASNQLADTSSLTVAGGTYNFANHDETFANLTQISGGTASGTSGHITITGTMTLSGGGAGGYGYTVTSGTAPWTSAGAVSLSGSYAAAAIQVGGLSSGSPNEFRVGSGGLSMTGQNIQLNVGNAAGQTGSRLVLGGDVTASGTNNFQLWNNAVGVAGQVNQIALDSATRVFNITSGTTRVFNNGATGTANLDITGSGGISKQGAGTLILDSASTYTGATSVAGGTLLVNGSLASATTADSGGTLGGTGDINGAVATAGMGKIDAGTTTTAGTLEVGDGATGLTLAGTSSLDVQIGGTSPGDGPAFHDQIAAKGSVTLGGATLNVALINGFAPAAAALQTFVIIDNDGTDAVSGTFAGLPEGSQISLGSGKFYISYAGGSDRNDVVLYSQPVFNGTSGPDVLVLRGDGTSFQASLNGAPPVNVTPPAGTPFHFFGAGGDDLLRVQYDSAASTPFTTPSTDPIPAGGVNYDGENEDNAVLPTPPQGAFNPPQTFGDVLAVEDLRAELTLTATYRPDAATFGKGVVTIAGGSGGTINFQNLEPVDVAGMAVVNVQFPGAADVFSLTNGKDAATNTHDALVISGSSGGVNFESLHLRNNAAVNIDTATGGSDGADQITIVSADNAHGNGTLSINTDGSADRLNLHGNVAIDGNLTLSGVENVVLGASVTIDTEQGSDGAGGNADFGGATVSADAAGRDLAIDTSTGLPAGNGGRVNLAVFSKAAPGAAFVNDLTITTTSGAGGTAGSLTLTGNISLDAAPSDAASLVVTGGGNIVLGANVTIDTEQGGDDAGGLVDLDSSPIDVTAAVSAGLYSLTINTLGNGSVGGAVSFGDVGVSRRLGGLNVNAGTGTVTLRGSQVETAAGPLVYESFNYAAGGDLNGKGLGDMGFRGNWSGGANWDMEAGNLSYPAGTKYTPQGNRATISGGGGAVNAPLGRTFNFAAEDVLYVSFLVRKGSPISQTSNEYLWLTLNNSTDGSSKASLGIGSSENPLLGTTTSAFSVAGSKIEADQDYLYVAKLVTNYIEGGQDRYYAAVFDSSGVIPEFEPSSWAVSYLADVSGTADRLRLEAGAAGHYTLDELRLGRTWAEAVGLLDSSAAVWSAASATGDVVLAGTVVLTQDAAVTTAGAKIDFRNATVRGDGNGAWDLQLDTSSAERAAGDVSLNVLDGGTANDRFLNDVQIDVDSGDGSAGTLTLYGNVSLDDDGDGDAGDLALIGGGAVRLAGDVTIDTEHGDDGGGGLVDFGSARISGDVTGGRDLTICTASGAGQTGGTVTLAGVDSSRGSFVEALTIDTWGSAGGTAGDVQFTTAVAHVTQMTVTGGAISNAAAAPIVTAGPLTFDAQAAVTLNGDVRTNGGTVAVNAGADVFVNAAIDSGAAIPADVLVETFETFGQGPTGYGASQTLVNGWSNDTTDRLDWASDLGGTPSGGTGPSVDHTLGTAGGTYLYAEASGTGVGFPGMTARLISPAVDLSSTEGAGVEFWYHMRGSQLGTLSVQASSDDGATWSADLFSVSGAQGNAWQRAVIDLSAYDGGSQCRLRFVDVTGDGYEGDVALDDVRFFGSAPAAAMGGDVTIAVGGAVHVADRVHSGGGDITLRAGATTGTAVALEGPVLAGAGNLTIDSAGAVSQAAAVSGTGLELLGAGPFDLSHADNAFDSLAADVTGSVTYTDTDALTIGTVAGMPTSGIATGGPADGGDVTVNAGGLLTVAQPISTAVGSGGVLNIGGGVAVHAGLTLGTGNITLDGGGSACDITIAADQNLAGDANLIAACDVLIYANVTTTAGGNILLTADSDNNGAGGVFVGPQAPTVGQLHSAGNLTIAGTSLIGTPAAGDQIRIEDDGTAGVPTLEAARTVTLTHGSSSATAPDVILHGQVQSGTDAVAITAYDSILLGTAGTVTAATAGTLMAEAGTIDDDDADDAADILADSVSLSAVTGIGTASSVDVNVNTVTGATSAAGGIALNLLNDAVGAPVNLAADHAVKVTLADALASGDLVLTGTTGSGTRTYASLDAHDGHVNVSAAAGDIVLVSVISDSGVAGTHDVAVTAPGGSVTINASVTSDDEVAISASGAINDDADDATADIIANTLTLTAGTGIGTSSSLDVNVNAVSGATSGAGGIALNLRNDAAAAIGL